MSLKRLSAIWWVYVVALFLVLAVMLHFTFQILAYERAQAEGEFRAAFEENVRLALWRMDSAAAVILATREPPPVDNQAGQAAKSVVQNQGQSPGQPIAQRGAGQGAAETQLPQQAKSAQVSKADGFAPQPATKAGGVSSYGVLQQRRSFDSQQMISQQEYTQRSTLNKLPDQDMRDWQWLVPELLETISDTFPGARLEPLRATVDPGSSGRGRGIKVLSEPKVDTRRLASIPARLVLPQDFDPMPQLPWNTAIRVSLLVAWACLVLAALAAGVLLGAVLALGERRAAFVSTVTHELRTPLTTFRMYSEMLAGGMVPDEASRKQYLQTLVTEADRLGHLIENVLAYARLERQLSPTLARSISVRELVERSRPGLETRVSQSGFRLHLDLPDACGDLICRTDTIAFHQVLLNLVDNACKYGRSDVSVRISCAKKEIRISVVDDGPGLDAGLARRLFKPFSKSRDDTVPGIGLGLHLSRRLARDLGGDLAYVPGAAGAEFVFTLPVG